MSCSPFDLRDYFLKELPEPERKQVEVHTRTCDACQEELERLRLTGAALLSLSDEEIPQRLAFVSDKVFEPAPWRRAWSAFWGSAARLGFASAAMLSVALIFFAVHGAGQKAGGRAGALTPPEMQQQIQAAVDRAVTAREAKLEQRIDEIERERDQFRLAADSLFDYSRREKLMLERSSYQ
jgi:anti-sigma factor RsiW